MGIFGIQVPTQPIPPIVKIHVLQIWSNYILLESLWSPDHFLKWNLCMEMKSFPSISKNNFLHKKHYNLNFFLVVCLTYHFKAVVHSIHNPFSLTKHTCQICLHRQAYSDDANFCIRNTTKKKLKLQCFLCRKLFLEIEGKDLISRHKLYFKR